MHNKFITFEGCEGSGKTTQSQKLYNYLLSKNVPAILTREIGGTEEAEEIRRVIVNNDLLPITELMLIIGARYEHVRKVVVPALQENKWVICDRFIDSTSAYQGLEIDDSLIFDLHTKLIEPCFRDINRSFFPDLTFFIDLPIEVSLARAKIRGDNNKFEAKNLAFHQKIYDKFCHISNKFKDRIYSIQASSLSEEEIFKHIMQHLDI
jgi:dTMP kinase